jgi:hypothetical protein
LDAKYFGLHHDLPPEQIAKQLGGDLVWKQEDQGQWVALIRFQRVLDAAAQSERGLLTLKREVRSTRRSACPIQPSNFPMKPA